MSNKGTLSITSKIVYGIQYKMLCKIYTAIIFLDRYLYSLLPVRTRSVCGEIDGYGDQNHRYIIWSPLLFQAIVLM